MIGTAMKILGTRRNATVLASALLALLLAMLAAPAAQAQNSWTVSISEKELKLETSRRHDVGQVAHVGYRLPAHDGPQHAVH